MLPQIYCDRYQEFSAALTRLQLSAADSPADGVALGQTFEQVQQLFAQRILTLDSDILEQSDISRVQSYLTEINKQLKLLGMDVMFLKAARQPTTVQQRLVQSRSRIETLINYCQAVLDG